MLTHKILPKNDSSTQIRKHKQFNIKIFLPFHFHIYQAISWHMRAQRCQHHWYGICSERGNLPPGSKHIRHASNCHHVQNRSLPRLASICINDCSRAVSVSQCWTLHSINIDARCWECCIYIFMRAKTGVDALSPISFPEQSQAQCPISPHWKQHVLRFRQSFAMWPLLLHLWQITLEMEPLLAAGAMSPWG